MYPIECFTVDNANKLEAVRYYVELNKVYLKEVSAEHCDDFCNFMEEEGKALMSEISVASTSKKMYDVLKKIEAKLPYAAKIKKIPDFEQKCSAIHREYAKLYVNQLIGDVDYKSLLKKQRELALEYDKLLDVVNTYQDAVENFNYVKEVARDKPQLIKLYEKNHGGKSFADFAVGFKESAHEFLEDLKTKRASAFDAIRGFYIKEMINMLEHDKEQTK